MEKTKVNARIISNTKLSEGVYSMWIKQSDLAQQSKAGQFMSLYCNEGSRLLPRPISICEINREEGSLRFVYRVAGKGTREFSAMNTGDTISVLGPLGNGFTMEGEKVLLIGGGIGIPPMLELAKEFFRKTKAETQIVLGYRDTLFLKEEFEAYGKVAVSTEDGSAGTKGNVLDAVREEKFTADRIFACGPLPMLKGIKDYSIQCGIKAQLSMEEHMACGIGACLACVCKSGEKDPHTNVNNKRVCKDGPVFYATDIVL